MALIVEDHPLYRDALINLLRPVLGEREIKAASSAEEGLRLGQTIRDLRLILIDLGLPHMRGVEAITAFRRAFPEARLVAISASDDRREVMAALNAGALVFISKAVSAHVLVNAVAEIQAGKVHEARWITPNGEPGALDDSSSTASLTLRQREVLTLLCQGHSNKEIGLRMGLAEITIKLHVSSIFRSLSVANRTQALLAARRLGLYAG